MKSSFMLILLQNKLQPFNLSQRLVPPYFDTLVTLNNYKAKHSAFRCTAQQAVGSYTIPLPTQKTPTVTDSQVRWPDKRRSIRLSLTFLLLFLSKKKSKERKRFKAKHSAFRCTAQQAAGSYTIPLPTQKTPTVTDSQVCWPGKKAACPELDSGSRSFVLDFFACLPTGRLLFLSKKKSKERKKFPPLFWQHLPHFLFSATNNLVNNKPVPCIQPPKPAMQKMQPPSVI